MRQSLLKVSWVVSLVVSVFLVSCRAHSGAKPSSSSEVPQGKGPETVVLQPETVKQLQDKVKDARLARLEAENLARELELIKLRLEKIVEQAKASQQASDEAFVSACAQAGIPASDVNNYEGTENEKGQFVLKRKPTQAAAQTP